MKAMSKLFLIISAIMVGVGIIICVVGYVMASNEGIHLYPEKIDGNYVYKVDLTGTDVSKISINATDVDSTVYTGQSEEYIEFINFNEAYGSVSVTNTVVSFDEYLNLSSLISFWDGGFKFKGMRSILDFSAAPEGDKAVNIYLSDERDMNVFAFTLEKGSICFENISSDTDYKLSLDKGEVTMKNVTTNSKVYIKATGCTATVDGCTFGSFIADVGELRLGGSMALTRECDINAKSGTVNAELTSLPENSAITVSTTGTISIDGVPYMGNYTNNTQDNKDNNKEKSGISVTGDTLNVTLNGITQIQ